VVVQGEAELTIVDVFVVEAAFRLEVSSSGLFIQIDGGMRLADIGKVTARGYLEITSAGMVVALSLDLDASILRSIGVDISGTASLRVNTTDTDRTIQPLSDNLLLEPIVLTAKTTEVRIAGELGVRVPGTSLTLISIRGVFLLVINDKGLSVLATGQTNFLSLLYSEGRGRCGN
jgi:hypothetical protein